MCSTEAPLCDAIKQVYRPQLPTFFSTTFHLYDKMPSPCPENKSPLADSSGIMTVGKQARCAEMEGDNYGLLKVIVTVVDYRVSFSSQFLWQAHGVNQHACWSVVGKMRKEGRWDRIALPGWVQGKKSHLIPQPRRPLAAHSIGGDRKGWCELSLCCVWIRPLCPFSNCAVKKTQKTLSCTKR